MDVVEDFRSNVYKFSLIGEHKNIFFIRDHLGGNAATGPCAKWRDLYYYYSLLTESSVSLALHIFIRLFCYFKKSCLV